MRCLPIFLSLILSGCGQIDLLPKLFVMPDEVRPFYNEYFGIVGTDKQVLGEIQFAQPSFLLDLDSHSVCLSAGLYYQLTLDQSYWNSATDDEKRTQMFHGLTHCTFLIRSHSSDSNNYMFYNQSIGFSLSDITPQVKPFI